MTSCERPLHRNRSRAQGHGAPHHHLTLLLLAATLGLAQATRAQAPPASPDSAAALSHRVEIIRTHFGVPHIIAEDWRAFGFAMGWVQSEDHGDQIAVGLVKDRGVYGQHLGRDSVAGDFAAREAHAVARARYGDLDPRTRAVYEGFAEGVNEYVRQNPDLFPAWLEPDFTGVDALVNDVYNWSRSDAARFVRARAAQQAAPAPSPAPSPASSPALAPLPSSWQAAEAESAALDDALDGSNAWALHPSRTTSGRAILLRNPHLSWTAGYYEAHVRIGDEVEFYGDFRIGGAFGIIGGFNRRLGWATTNNSPTYTQVYALAWADSTRREVLVDGRPAPLRDSVIVVDWREADDTRGTAADTTRWSPWGPVIDTDDAYAYVLTDPRDGQFRRGDQLVGMMSATTLDEWLEVMRMRAHASSNFTYADADGNIALYYNARIPDLPHPASGDSAVVAHSSDDMWHELVPWSELPLYVNPPGGYVQQANDTPDFINLNVPMDRDTMPHNLPEPRLRLRSQLSFDLIHGDDRLSLEDVIARKHSPRMLAAERMLDDLLGVLDTIQGRPELGRARSILDSWDRTAAADSRGGVLFKAWFEAYTRSTDSLTYRRAWHPDEPMATPVGIGDPEAAVAAMDDALSRLAAEGIAPAARWGDVHRVIRGDVDEPVSGCEGTLGCFRTLSFERLADGRRAANRGDAWVFAVEFGDVPRGYSILAYGQSRLPDSPHHDDQAQMFAQNEMKPILWTQTHIDQATLRRYRPGRPN